MSTVTAVPGHPDYELVHGEQQPEIRTVRRHGTVVGHVRYYTFPVRHWEARLMLPNPIQGVCGSYEAADQAAVAVVAGHQGDYDPHLLPAFSRRDLPGWVDTISPEVVEAAEVQREAAKAAGHHQHSWDRAARAEQG